MSNWGGVGERREREEGTGWGDEQPGLLMVGSTALSSLQRHDFSDRGQEVLRIRGCQCGMAEATALKAARAAMNLGRSIVSGPRMAEDGGGWQRVAEEWQARSEGEHRCL